MMQRYNKRQHGAQQRWYHHWKDRQLLSELLLSVIALAGGLMIYSSYLIYNESRPGSTLADPLLEILPMMDVSIPIFGIIYGAILLGIYSLLGSPRSLLLALQSYTALILIRIVALYLTPLAPPPEMIPLYDPMAGFGPGDILHRDLFFSGHTSTLFLLFLIARTRPIRWIFLACTAAVGMLVLVQHCHYSIDVLAAPFFAYGCYRLAACLSGAITIRGSG